MVPERNSMITMHEKEKKYHRQLWNCANSLQPSNGTLMKLKSPQYAWIFLYIFFLNIISFIVTLAMVASESIQDSYDLGPEAPADSETDISYEDFEKLHADHLAVDDEERNQRKELHSKAVQEIKSHNEQYKKGEKSYFKGLTPLSHLTEEEMLQWKTGRFNPN